MDNQIQAFLEQYHAAAMITIRPNGQPHVARVNTRLVDGKLWSSGTETRVRTRNLRRDPRATIFVWGDALKWIGIEARVTIYDGPDGWEKNLAYRRAMGREPVDVNAFMRELREEGRLIFEFDITRAYGAYA